MEPDYKARKRCEPTMALKERVYSRTAINERSGCWEWLGSKHKGYGKLTVGSRADGSRKSAFAHRVSYEIAFGKIPDGMEVCHKCDNPSCINPDHLFLGTRQDNVLDRQRKGRNINHSGEEQTRAKLTKKAVKDARWERAYKGTSFSKLAEKYGVCKCTMQRAISGRTWRCVKYMPEPPKEGNE